MTTRSIILHPHEIAAALEKKLRLVVRPVKPQPVPTIIGQQVDLSLIGPRCPLGVPWTRLAGKETWRVGAWRDYADDPGKFAFDYKASPGMKRTPWVFAPDEDAEFSMRENTIWELRNLGVHMVGGRYVWEPGESPLSWRSPATMPAWASRITLVNESVSVCRLDDITEQEAKDAGFQGDSDSFPRGRFLYHWQVKHRARGLGIGVKTWIWKVAVKVVEK